MLTGALCSVEQVDCSNAWLMVSDIGVSEHKRVGALFYLTVASKGAIIVTVSNCYLDMNIWLRKALISVCFGGSAHEIRPMVVDL